MYVKHKCFRKTRKLKYPFLWEQGSGLGTHSCKNTAANQGETRRGKGQVRQERGRVQAGAGLGQTALVSTPGPERGEADGLGISRRTRPGQARSPQLLPPHPTPGCKLQKRVSEA